MSIKQLTILSSNGLVIVNNQKLWLNDERLAQMQADGIRAVQWRDGKGHIEYSNVPQNEGLESIEAYQWAIDAHADELAHQESEQGCTSWQHYDRETGEITTDLGSLIQARRDEVQTLFDQYLGQGVAHDGYIFDCDEDSQSRIGNAAQLAQTAASLGQDFAPISWTTADNQLYEIKNLEQLNALGLAIGAHVQTLYAVRNQHKSAINNLITEADILAYDITTGWEPAAL